MKAILITLIGLMGFSFCLANTQKTMEEQRQMREERVVYLRQDVDRKINAMGLSWVLKEPRSPKTYNYFFEYLYPFTDTIGSQQRFERALSPDLQQAVRKMAEETSSRRITISVSKNSNGEKLCLLAPYDNSEYGAEGFLLYKNTILVIIEDIVDELIRSEELKKIPYDQFLSLTAPVISGDILFYDGPFDAYRIVEKDRLEYLGVVTW